MVQSRTLSSRRRNNSGFYGNLGRDTLIGPGLATWDFSVLKDTPIFERLNLQFRAEIFNLLDRANFNTPNLIMATCLATTPVANPAAGPSQALRPRPGKFNSG